MISLSPRLLAAASLVKGDGRAADIGTDHAHLPVYLILNGIIPGALACDIGEGPLNNAGKTVSEYALEEKIELRLSDGLDKISPNEAENIIICGMGGELIVSILTRCSWIKDRRYNLVLQPMTHSEDVRRYLLNNGFEIENELCVSEGKRSYLTMNAVWNGKLCSFEEGYCYFGELINSDDEPARKYIKKQYDRILKRADALKASGRDREEEKLLRDVLEYYAENRIFP